ncbi:MAG: exosortase/archaeosortase family protein [Planctomycetota bacterium]|jgi:exosortase/archaeosortase family protein|nr:exosortase/archaeosortase family protein [Planctomycetota bacterium]MDP6761673.1 exosortase/archaeosortase family protein [Planctomycetota bacterium]MDP6990698.1 exosortase/archaeosortase family protein [Planctomycetota bacterium]
MPARPRAARAASAVLVLAAFWPLIAEWAAYAWRDPRLGYSLLVPILALILCRIHAPAPGQGPARWTGAESASPAGRTGAGGAACLLGAALCLAGGVVLGRFTLALVGLPLGVIGWVAAWGGTAALRRQVWALALLFFLVPPPQPLVDRVQPWAAATSGAAARWLLRPLDAECLWLDSTLHYRGWELWVSEDCAGSGTTLTLMVLSVFLGGLFRLRPSAAICLALLSLPASLAVNSLRIASTGVLLDAFGPGAVDGVPHELLGQALVLGASGLTAFGVARLTPAREATGS